MTRSTRREYRLVVCTGTNVCLDDELVNAMAALAFAIGNRGEVSLRDEDDNLVAEFDRAERAS